MLQHLLWHLLVAVRLLLEMVIASKSGVAAVQLSQYIQTANLECVGAPGSATCRTCEHVLVNGVCS